jgi:hypothetical protein
MLTRLILLAGITLAVVGGVNASLPTPPCDPCMVDTAVAS